jgi:hypothetical protein
MARTRAASPHTGARPRLVCRTHDRSEEFPTQETVLTWAELDPKRRKLERVTSELVAYSAGWDSPSPTTDAGRMPNPRASRRMLREALLQQQIYYGVSPSWDDYLRTTGLTAQLSTLIDELTALVEYWDAYGAEPPAGFAHDSPEPAAPRAPLVRANDLEPQPPTERARQLTAAPGAPPAGITAS